MSPAVSDAEVLRGVGPQDVDAAGDLTSRVGTHNQARRVIQLAAGLVPRGLTAAQMRQIDEGRTAYLDFDEVEDRVKDEFDGAKRLLSARVHGFGDHPDTHQVVVVYELESSGRSQRGVLPYKDLSKSGRAFTSAEKEGRVAVGSPEDREALVKENKSLREELAALRRAAEGREAGGEEPTPEPYEGYEDAKAGEVTDRVSELSDEELDALEQAEKDGKERKTVLEAISTEREQRAAG